MESMLNFVNKFTDVVKKHLDEAKECIGKDVVDSTATKSGVCVDRIKHVFGVKFSLLGHVYKDSEVKEIESGKGDMIVCQGNNGYRFFVPASEVLAVGDSVILIKPTLNQPEVSDTKSRKEEVFRKYFQTKEGIKHLLPKVEQIEKRKRKIKSLARLFH
jgi:sporulation protein YlmC with PRC-barrel domain